MSGIGANPVENNGLALSLPYIIKSPSAAVISPNQYIVKTNYHQLYPPSGSVIISSKQMAATSTAAHLLQQQFQAQVQAAANIANGITTGVPNTNGVPSTAPVAAPGNYYGPSSMYFNPNVMPPTATKQTWVPNTPKFVKKITPENRPNNLAQRQNNRLNDSFENSRPRHNSSPPETSMKEEEVDDLLATPLLDTASRRDRSRRDYRLSPVRTHHPPYSRARDQYRESRDYDKATPPPVANLFNALQQPTLHYHGDSNPKTVELARRKYSPTRRYQNQGSSSRGRGMRVSGPDADMTTTTTPPATAIAEEEVIVQTAPPATATTIIERTAPIHPEVHPNIVVTVAGLLADPLLWLQPKEADRLKKREFAGIPTWRIRKMLDQPDSPLQHPDLHPHHHPASATTTDKENLFHPHLKPRPSVPSVLLANFNHDLMQKTQLNGTHTHTLLNAGDLDNKVDISDEEDTTLAAVAINPADMVDYEGETLTSQPVNWRVLNLFSGRVDSKLLQNYISFAGARPQSAVGRTFPLPSKHPTPQQLNDPDFYVPGAISSDEEEEEISEREVDDEEDEEESQEVKSQESEKSQDNQPKKQPETQYPVHFLLRNNNLSV
uniref:Uncharacterized protein n=1 Tax=Ditylenchus dipsaci TaxID=166011 RepID=A0A915DBU7_9BILA